jgi:hypothetical protein
MQAPLRRWSGAGNRVNCEAGWPAGFQPRWARCPSWLAENSIRPEGRRSGPFAGVTVRPPLCFAAVRRQSGRRAIRRAWGVPVSLSNHGVALRAVYVHLQLQGPRRSVVGPWLPCVFPRRYNHRIHHPVAWVDGLQPIGPHGRAPPRRVLPPADGRDRERCASPRTRPGPIRGRIGPHEQFSSTLRAWPKTSRLLPWKGPVWRRNSIKWSYPINSLKAFQAVRCAADMYTAALTYR